MARLPDLVAEEIDHLTSYFESTGNVAAAWRVFSLARKTGRSVPAPVAAEIDRFADGVASVAGRAMQATPNDGPLYFTPEKLGALWRGDGGQNPADTLRRDWRDMQIGFEVGRRVERGEKVGAAIEAVADDLPYVNAETVRKAWQKVRREG